MSRDKLNCVEFSADSLRAFAKESFGSLKGLAEAMGISSQHLQAYLNGNREWGASFREKLASVGFIKQSPPEIKRGLNEAFNTNSLNTKGNADHGSRIFPDIGSACRLLNCTPEDLAQRIGAPREDGLAWVLGKNRPTYDQLASLYHQVLSVAMHNMILTQAKAEAAKELESIPRKAVG